MASIRLEENMLEQPECSQVQSHVELPSQVSREQVLRHWIANKESVCPYAPGVAYVTYLPRIQHVDIEHVRFLAAELKAFYRARDEGQRVSRWILLPHAEWQGHGDGLEQATQLYWLLLAAYHYLNDDVGKVRQAMRRRLGGVASGARGEICNPIVGKFARHHGGSPHYKSLFCTALAPTYRSRQFYRWAPTSCLVLVYAQDLLAKKTAHPKTMHHISLDMMRGNFEEIFGAGLDISREQLALELPLWRELIQYALQMHGHPVECSQGGISTIAMNAFRSCSMDRLDALVWPHLDRLPVMLKIMQLKALRPAQILASHFSGTGLYVLPDYLSS